ALPPVDCRREAARDTQHGLVHIEASHRAGRADARRGGTGQHAGAATDVQHPVAFGDAGEAAGRAAILTGRWHDACAAVEAAAAEEETPEVLDGLGEVRYQQGDYAAAIELRERAYAGFRARGDTRYPAVLAAYYLAFDYAAVFGNVAAAKGWVERGKRLAAV